MPFGHPAQQLSIGSADQKKYFFIINDFLTLQPN
jgi:hypothetical protein